MVDIQRLRAMSLKATRDRGMFINALLGAFMNMGVYRRDIQLMAMRKGTAKV